MKYYALDFAVQGALNEAGETTPHQYARYLQFAFDVCRDELSCILPHYLKTVKLSMETNNTITLPSDCVLITKIGIQNGDTIGILSMDADLGLGRSTDDCASPLPNSNDTDNFLVNCYDGCGIPYTLFGFGQPKNSLGTYRIDYERNQIQFGSDADITEIYLEYKSNGLMRDEESIIPAVAVPVVKAYIHWKRLQFKRSASGYDKESAKKEYTDAKKNMRLKVFTPNEKDLRTAINKGRHQGMKY